MNIIDFDILKYEDDLTKNLFQTLMREWKKKEGFVSDRITVPEDNYISYKFVMELIARYNSLNPSIVFIPVYNIPLI